MSLPDTMRAARLHRPRSPEGPEDVRIDEVPVPAPADGEVLVQVRACGICASDLHVVAGVTPHGPRLPQILGHEPAGVIAAVGDGVGDWQVGDRVAWVMSRPCGRCEYCRAGRENLCVTTRVAGVDVDGVQAEYAVADARFLVPLPADLPFDQAAIVTDAVATPYHALKRGGVGPEMTVAVIGLGGLGMHAVLLAKLAGATVVGVDVAEANLERALAWGADEVVDARQDGVARRIRELTEGGVDRSFEFVGHRDTVDQAVKALRPGGRATIVGLGPEAIRTVPVALFVAQETELVGSFGYTQQDLGELYDLVEDGRLDLSRSVTDRLPIEAFPDALRRLETREGNPVRIVVTYPA
ncbi:alcohol dehydrogenase catalytic domain-containing protein [Egicoccus halophilus]|uniref:Alcohol dehydrogenase n=1 Tax=Egicoccus halophilus TaxID=1670830 RepID=A0A8J3A7X7_9ACTN|nr:zinc-binding dehydrogenase [Egicoccus halophilus]GGI04193.1 alcohol dehydrogenase [Egicoccus halophilus]